MKIRQVLDSIAMASLMVVSPISFGVTEHDNVVEFHSKPGDKFPQVTSIVFYFYGNYSITSGQPWDGVTTNNTSGDYPAYQVDALAGRKGSNPPASFFFQHAGNAWISIDDCFDPTNLVLNFAFSGVLEIEGNDYNIMLGQVGCAGGNPWYVGANQMGFTVDGNGWLLTPDGQYRINSDGSAENEFKVMKNQ